MAQAGERSKTLTSAPQLAKRRLLRNFDDGLRGPAAAYARAHGLRLVVHSDSALPPLWEQLRRFASARVVVAPLGAAQVGMLAAPAGTCLVEVQEATWDPTAILHPTKSAATSRGVAASSSRGAAPRAPHGPLALGHNDSTYQELTRLLGQRYVRVPSVQWRVAPAAVDAGLARCAL